MTYSLEVRMYNVRFGDAILVTIPDRHPSTGEVTKRRMLIDVGNAPKMADPEGGDDTVFKPVIDDILEQLAGEPLDLYVMTHEHLDHVQGIPHAAWKLYPADFDQRFQVNHVWLTASAAPDYYDTHPEAKKRRMAFEEMHQRLKRFLEVHATPQHRSMLEFLANNDPTKTKRCVEFLRGLNSTNTSYIYRGASLDGTHPFREAKLEVWAPEEDTSDYYGRFQPIMLGETTLDSSRGISGAGAAPRPPSGVDVGAFLNLVESRRNSIGDNLLTIDKAANNTSIVFMLEWRGWRLLFTGDAELRSWKTMQREGVLKPVHFLKVSHHGSHNGTPEDEIFDAILPKTPPADRNQLAAISTWTNTYSGIPHPPTDERVKERAELFTTLDDKEDLYFDLVFPG